MRKKLGSSFVRKSIIWAMSFMMTFSPVAGSIGTLVVSAEDGQSAEETNNETESTSEGTSCDAQESSEPAAQSNTPEEADEDSKAKKHSEDEKVNVRSDYEAAREAEKDVAEELGYLPADVVKTEAVADRYTEKSEKHWDNAVEISNRGEDAVEGILDDEADFTDKEGNERGEFSKHMSDAEAADAEAEEHLHKINDDSAIDLDGTMAKVQAGVDNNFDGSLADAQAAKNELEEAKAQAEAEKAQAEEDLEAAKKALELAEADLQAAQKVSGKSEEWAKAQLEEAKKDLAVAVRAAERAYSRTDRISGLLIDVYNALRSGGLAYAADTEDNLESLGDTQTSLSDAVEELKKDAAALADIKNDPEIREAVESLTTSVENFNESVEEVKTAAGELSENISNAITTQQTVEGMHKEYEDARAVYDRIVEEYEAALENYKILEGEFEAKNLGELQLDEEGNYVKESIKAVDEEGNIVDKAVEAPVLDKNGKADDETVLGNLYNTLVAASKTMESLDAQMKVYEELEKGELKSAMDTLNSKDDTVTAEDKKAAQDRVAEALIRKEYLDRNRTVKSIEWVEAKGETGAHYVVSFEDGSKAEELYFAIDEDGSFKINEKTKIVETAVVNEKEGILDYENGKTYFVKPDGTRLEINGALDPHVYEAETKGTDSKTEEVLTEISFRLKDDYNDTVFGPYKVTTDKDSCCTEEITIKKTNKNIWGKLDTTDVTIKYEDGKWKYKSLGTWWDCKSDISTEKETYTSVETTWDVIVADGISYKVEETTGLIKIEDYCYKDASGETIYLKKDENGNYWRREAVKLGVVKYETPIFTSGSKYLENRGSVENRLAASKTGVTEALGNYEAKVTEYREWQVKLSEAKQAVEAHQDIVDEFHRVDLEVKSNSSTDWLGFAGAVIKDEAARKAALEVIEQYGDPGDALALTEAVAKYSWASLTGNEDNQAAAAAAISELMKRYDATFREQLGDLYDEYTTAGSVIGNLADLPLDLGDVAEDLIASGTVKDIINDQDRQTELRGYLEKLVSPDTTEAEKYLAAFRLASMLAPDNDGFAALAAVKSDEIFLIVCDATDYQKAYADAWIAAVRAKTEVVISAIELGRAVIEAAKDGAAVAGDAANVAAVGGVRAGELTLKVIDDAGNVTVAAVREALTKLGIGSGTDAAADTAAAGYTMGQKRDCLSGVKNLIAVAIIAPLQNEVAELNGKTYDAWIALKKIERELDSTEFKPGSAELEAAMDRYDEELVRYNELKANTDSRIETINVQLTEAEELLTQVDESIEAIETALDNAGGETGTGTETGGTGEGAGTGTGTGGAGTGGTGAGTGGTGTGGTGTTTGGGSAAMAANEINIFDEATALSASIQEMVFDPIFYAAMYPDVTAQWGDNAEMLRLHYETFGIQEGRYGNAYMFLARLFSAAEYTEMYSDLTAAGITTETGLSDHYFMMGIFEGRRPSKQIIGEVAKAMKEAALAEQARLVAEGTDIAETVYAGVRAAALKLDSLVKVR